jgi:hypothetical protein
MTMTIVEATRVVTGGVDTHLDVHVAAALDPPRALLGTERFATDSAGYKALSWLESFGAVTRWESRARAPMGPGWLSFCGAWPARTTSKRESKANHCCHSRSGPCHRSARLDRRTRA